MKQVYKLVVGAWSDNYNVCGDAYSRKEKIRLGNAKARIRMILLYDMAQHTEGMVLSTDNYTEYLLGYWTLHGDVGDYGMIQRMWKTEVYELAEYLKNELNYYYSEITLLNEQAMQECQAMQKCIDAVPTDGLGITDSDFDQLGVSSYTEVDKILMLRYETTDPDNPIIKRHINSGFKRCNPVNIPRETILKGA